VWLPSVLACAAAHFMPEGGPVFDHVSLKVQNFRQSLEFYRAALAPLGFEAQYVDHEGKSAGFGPKGAVGLWIAEGAPPSGVHIAFATARRNAVRHFHEAGLEAGGRDNGKPGLRADYASDYYAAFLVDPDGNNVEAVSHGEGGES
jgi:catechol 2,3-dioxygenase-like lactoylglutathione lyase family enzyme